MNRREALSTMVVAVTTAALPAAGSDVRITGCGVFQKSRWHHEVRTVYFSDGSNREVSEMDFAFAGVKMLISRRQVKP